ncbi:MAG: carboxypeptidase-like regulatory domain-containing protein, partial [Bacteroidota bacterium]
MGRVLEDNKREILRKWLQGAANEEEQRQLKQWSKHDPFLAEAMEGYEAVSSDDHIVTIDRLRQQFTRGKKTMRTAAAPARPSPAAAARSGSSSRINLSFLAIAASVLVLLGVGTWVFRQSNETQGALESMAVEQSAGPAKEETSLPEAETKTEDALAANTPDPASATATAPIIEETILVADESSPIAAVENITVPTETTQPTVYNDGNIEAGFEAPAEIAESTVVDFDAEAAPLPRANAPARLGGSSTSPIQNTSTEDVVAEKMEQINNPRPVVGYVFASQSGRPLSGARIAIDNSNESVITDGSGRFEVVVDENIAGLRVSRMGFNEAVVTISQQDTSLSIALNESEQLAEVTTRAKAKGRGKVAAS